MEIIIPIPDSQRNWTIVNGGRMETSIPFRRSFRFLSEPGLKLERYNQEETYDR
ncbi:hypothetical protein HOLDEFILI_04093 [Holdemania filiformis DSM 12042]|uniref:Uncharacterized protein n=1 Tax=Holdemania filiformis DSM 12042 TaxID=545696 RepID=B9YE19_9FIRM|nr:hypothetical protein HOLDEFILI_04093 [Holdemania filiformis DSM 12042]